MANIWYIKNGVFSCAVDPDATVFTADLDALSIVIPDGVTRIDYSNFSASWHYNNLRKTEER